MCIFFLCLLPERSKVTEDFLGVLGFLFFSFGYLVWFCLGFLKLKLLSINQTNSAIQQLQQRGTTKMTKT